MTIADSPRHPAAPSIAQTAERAAITSSSPAFHALSMSSSGGVCLVASLDT